MNYECPNCDCKMELTKDGKAYCFRCGSEMQLKKFYSELIWPIKKEEVREELGYSNKELDRIEKEIHLIENTVSIVGGFDIKINIPRTDARNIYELRYSLNKLESKIGKEVDDRLKLSELRKMMERQDDVLETLTGFSSSSKTSTERYRITVEYLQERLKENFDETLKAILERLEQRLHEYEVNWKPRVLRMSF